MIALCTATMQQCVQTLDSISLSVFTRLRHCGRLLLQCHSLSAYDQLVSIMCASGTQRACEHGAVQLC